MLVLVKVYLTFLLSVVIFVQVSPYFCLEYCFLANRRKVTDSKKKPTEPNWC